MTDHGWREIHASTLVVDGLDCTPPTEEYALALRAAGDGRKALGENWLRVYRAAWGSWGGLEAPGVPTRHLAARRSLVTGSRARGAGRWRHAEAANRRRTGRAVH